MMRNGPEADDRRFDYFRGMALGRQADDLVDYAAALGVTLGAMADSIRGKTPLESPLAPSAALRHMRELSAADATFAEGIDALGLDRKVPCRCAHCQSAGAIGFVVSIAALGDLP